MSYTTAEKYNCKPLADIRFLTVEEDDYKKRNKSILEKNIEIFDSLGMEKEILLLNAIERMNGDGHLLICGEDLPKHEIYNIAKGVLDGK